MQVPTTSSPPELIPRGVGADGPASAVNPEAESCADSPAAATAATATAYGAPITAVPKATVCVANGPVATTSAERVKNHERVVASMADRKARMKAMIHDMKSSFDQAYADADAGSAAGTIVSEAQGATPAPTEADEGALRPPAVNDDADDNGGWGADWDAAPMSDPVVGARPPGAGRMVSDQL